MVSNFTKFPTWMCDSSSDDEDQVVPETQKRGALEIHIDEQTEELKDKVEDIKEVFVKGIEISGKCMEALNDSIQMKLEEHTEFIKDDIDTMSNLVIEGTDTMKRKIEDQAEEVKSVKKKLNEMDEKMDKMMMLLGGSGHSVIL
jgi:hypothetical protein